MKLNPYLSIIIAVSFGAFNGVLVKWLDLPSTVITFFRLAVPAVLLFLFVKLYQKRKIFRGNYKLMLSASVLNALRMFLYFLAFSYTTVANGVIMLYTWPIFGSIFGVLLLKEKNKLKEWLLISLAFLGVVTMMAGQELSFSNKDLLGMAIMLTSAAIYSITVIIFKKESNEYSPVETIFYQSIVGAVLFSPFIIFHKEVLTLANSLISMAHFGLLVGIGSFVLIFSALKKLKMLHFSLTNYWEVVAGVLYGIIILAERPTWNMAVGGSMIVLAGILLIYRTRSADSPT